ncbi:hypothetical protein KXV99_001083, partial [Aspergillus fumigatus]
GYVHDWLELEQTDDEAESTYCTSFPKSDISKPWARSNNRHCQNPTEFKHALNSFVRILS